ncbi:unnamed protein product [Ectocarpus sp. 6 AP-2014]
MEDMTWWHAEVCVLPSEGLNMKITVHGSNNRNQGGSIQMWSSAISRVRSEIKGYQQLADGKKVCISPNRVTRVTR